MIESNFPVDRVISLLLDALERRRVAILKAPTGSGKTTRVPPALLAAGLAGKGKILLLQPRRVAARACARTMASLRGEDLGDTVGFVIRFERRESARTKILVMTEGILARALVRDPLLEGVNCVILDEFHERSIHTDLCLAFVRELLGLRDDLKLLVMSATLETKSLAAYLDDCPIIEASGRQFPLSIHYLDTRPGDSLGQRVEMGLLALLNDKRDDGGDVLVFLPGAPEIGAVRRHLATRTWPFEIHALHGSLSSRDQDAVLSAGKCRRVILSTNIAETSLTIPGVTAVVDSGYCKSLIFDTGKGMDRLDRVRISQASADQRAGRAGRLSPGRVVRLWSESLQAMLPAADPPEISRADLSGPLLQVLDFHGPDLASFPFFERPDPSAVARCLETLELLGAIDAAGRLTSRGKKLALLPLHPRLGRILEAGAAAGLAEDAARLCALLNERPIARPLPELVTQVDILADRVSAPPNADRNAIIAAKAAAKQLLALAGGGQRMNPNAHGPIEGRSAARLLLAGYPDRLCRTRSAGLAVMAGGRGVSFDAIAGESLPPLFIALDLSERGEQRTTAKAGQIVAISIEDACAALPVETRQSAIFDADREAVLGIKQLVYGQFVLTERESGALSGPEIEAVLAKQADLRFDSLFQPEGEAGRLLARLKFAARYLPEEPWPAVDDAGLRGLLAQACQGNWKLSQLRRTDWRGLLDQRLDWRLRDVLDRQVPDRIAVPSGSRIVLDYGIWSAPLEVPILAVRLQEVFGWTDPPKLARGRVAPLIHLLAPNRRPVQMTRDLNSFWNTTYAEVRKELRRRYPKHAWPEDPWTADPVRGVPKRR